MQKLQGFPARPGRALLARGLASALALACGMAGGVARADDTPAPADAPGKTEAYAIHAQATFVAQGVGGFASPYVGTNSLHPHQVRETGDATLFVGVRPWHGAEIWINPEVDQGFGLSNTLGVAGFPSAEAYKVGKSNPYVKLQRLFLRQTIDLGGASHQVEGAANQLAGTTTANRIVITAGKIGVGDVFDTNAYAHDPRGDFLNWSLVDTGSFDYAANAWGYSYGVAVEWYQGAWTGRAGLFNLSTIPNGEDLESNFSQNQLDLEIEHRHQIAGHDGAVRVTVFRNHGRFGRFADALAVPRGAGDAPDTGDVRRPMTRWGVAANAEQALTDTLGVFARAGYSDGAIETYDFTDIDRTLALGGALKGKGWGRPQDTLGLAGVVNGISGAHQAYLAAGGIGVLVGDGALAHAGDEHIIEAYYAWRPVAAVAVTVDYQFVGNPGYNRDRGPANVFGLRLHVGV